MTATLTSEKNPLLKEVRRAAARGELTEDGCAVAEGVHLLEEALRSPVEIAAVIVAERARSEAERLLQGASAVRLVVVPDAVFSKIATTEHSQGVISLVRLKPPALSVSTPLIVVLDGIQDPGNAGAVVRAAEAFGATGAVFPKGAVSRYNPKCLRASAGSLFRLPVEETLAQGDLVLYAAMPRADLLLNQADFTGPCAIVIGSEGRGVSPDLAARSIHVSIPTSRVESLNAAVAAGVMLYEAQRQRSQRQGAKP